MHDPGPRGRAPAPERRFARTGLSCLASLSVHGIAFACLYAAGAFTLPRPRTLPVAMHELTAAEWQANRGLSGAIAPALAEPPDRPRQVVSLPPDTHRDPLREERQPRANARFLAERDQTVDRETISRYAGIYANLLRVPQEKARGRQGSGERGAHKVAIAGREGPRGGGGTEAEAVVPRPAPEEKAVVPTDPPTTPADATASLPPPESALPADGQGGQRIDGRHISGMPLQEYPTPEGGPNFDGLGLEEGAETRLHTRRFAPAAYWADVRARIQDDWHRRALVLLQEWDPHEDTYFYKPRTVRVAITIDAKGTVSDVHVLESSRLEFYDAIALAAIKGKQPYPPPPPAAVRPDGSARINMAFTWLPSDRSKELR
ncbi:MAG TPA: TonB family protein [Anaeromyxobacter sp.]